jgi:hypothetical protein
MLKDGKRCHRDNQLAAQPGTTCSRNSARKKLHPNRKCIPPYHRTVAGDSDLLVEEKFELPRQGYVPGVNPGACRAHVQDQATERFREGAGWNRASVVNTLRGYFRRSSMTFHSDWNSKNSDVLCLMIKPLI